MQLPTQESMQTKPEAGGPVFLMCLFDITNKELSVDEQVEAFTSDLNTTLVSVGKLDSAAFQVVGVDSNEDKIVVEVVIDGCDKQDSLAIFNTVEALEPFEEPKEKDAKLKDKEDDAKEDAVKEANSDDDAKKDAKEEDVKEAKTDDDAKKVDTTIEDKKMKEDAKPVTIIEGIRAKAPGAKNLTIILSGPCQHVLCMQSKKALALSTEKQAIADIKQRELEDFIASQEFITARRCLDETQAEFEQAEMSLRLRAADQGKIKGMWIKHITVIAEALDTASENFEALEDKRIRMSLDKVKAEAAAKFAKEKADNARKLSSCIACQDCPSFTTYIELEEYYASDAAQICLPVPAQPFVGAVQPYFYPQQQQQPVFNQHPLQVLNAQYSQPPVPASSISYAPGYKDYAPRPQYIQQPAPFYGYQPMYQSYPTQVYTSSDIGQWRQVGVAPTPVTQTSTVTTTEIRQVAKPADKSIYATQDENTQSSPSGFLQGDSVTLPNQGKLAATLDVNKDAAATSKMVQPC